MIELKSPFEYIPTELHLISLFLTALLGFFLIIGNPSVKLPTYELNRPPVVVKSEPIDDFGANGSVVSNENEHENDDAPPMPEVTTTTTTTTTMEFSTPTKKELPPRTPGRRKKGSANSTPTTPTMNVSKNTYGSITTPLGRRSARVAQRSAHK